jgi:hypothetical protein
MAPLPWQQFTERMVGRGHPTLADTNNRALRELLTQSGYDPDASPFPGLMGPVFNPWAFAGSSIIDDGTTNATPAFLAMLSAGAGKTVFIPNPNVGYLLTAQLTFPNNTTVIGGGKHSCRLIHGYNGNFGVVNGGARLEGFYIDGAGASFTGRGLVFNVGEGKQTLRSLKVIDFADYCLDFAHEAAGSQFLADDCECAQLIGASVGQEAVVIRGSLTAAANPRIFIGIQSQGKRFIDMGPCNNLFLIGCRVDGVKFDDNSRGVSITACRIGSNFTPQDIRGQGIAISACDIGPQVFVKPGVQSLTLKGNTYNNLPIIDEAFHASNVLEDQKYVDRTVTSDFIVFSASDTTPSVGQGNRFHTANVSPTIITMFDNGVDGQEITLRLDVNTGITHNNSFIRLARSLSIPTGNVNANDFITLLRLGGIWFEQSRSFPVQAAGIATYDPPSLADGIGATTTVAVTDAALGDFAEASFSLDLQGITVTAWVSSAGVVSVRFQNETGGLLDLASGTLRATVRKL